MFIIIGFAPFILFAILMDVSVSLALWAAFAASFGIGMYGFLHTRELRILDLGGVVLFGLLALYTGFIQPSLPTESVRFVVDAGFLITALISLALRKPLTLQYAREHVPWQEWNAPVFLRTNYILTWVWTLAFAIMAAVDAGAAFWQYVPLSLDMAASLCVLSLVIIFTARYPAFLRHEAQGRLTPKG